MTKLAAIVALTFTLTAIVQVPAPRKLPQFDVVSIKLNTSGEEPGIMALSPHGDSIQTINAPMFRIVEFAFGFERKDLLVGAPEWTRTARWDIEAKVAPADLPAFHALTPRQQKDMLQSVLAERCKLQAHPDKKNVPVYSLVIAKNGLKMKEEKTTDQSSWDIVEAHGEIRAHASPIDALLYSLSKLSLDRQVVDRTGLKGTYNFDLLWSPSDDPVSDSSTDATRPSLFTALQEQLGLQLVPGRALVNALVIDHIERPTAN